VAGLPAALAATLARATVAGAGELLHRSPLDATTLRQNVTSPGGTTAAALEVLMAEGGLERLMTAAIAAATKRSRDLAGGADRLGRAACNECAASADTASRGRPWNHPRGRPTLIAPE